MPEQPTSAWLTRRGVILITAFALAIDGVLVAVDAIFGSGPNLPDVLHVHHEGGIPEWFQWLQLLGASVVLFILGRRRLPLYFVWSGMFFFLFLNDAFMGHERVAGHLIRGLNLEEALTLPFPLYALLEPLYMAAVALLFVVVLWRVGKRSSSARARRYSIQALVLLAALFGFAAAGDFVDRAIFEGAHAAEVFEEAGEMIVVTFLLSHGLRQQVIERVGHEPGARRSSSSES